MISNDKLLSLVRLSMKNVAISPEDFFSNTPMVNLGMNSIALIELIVRLEQFLGKEINEEDMLGVQSGLDLLVMINNKT